jgi:hypothetical protein
MGGTGGPAFLARHRAIAIRIGAIKTLKGAGREFIAGDTAVAIGVGIRAVGPAFGVPSPALFVHGLALCGVDTAIAIAVHAIEMRQRSGACLFAGYNAVTVGIHPAHSSATAAAMIAAPASAFGAVRVALFTHGRPLACVNCAIGVGTRKTLVNRGVELSAGQIAIAIRIGAHPARLGNRRTGDQKRNCARANHNLLRHLLHGDFPYSELFNPAGISPATKHDLAEECRRLLSDHDKSVANCRKIPAFRG